MLYWRRSDNGSAIFFTHSRSVRTRPQAPLVFQRLNPRLNCGGDRWGQLGGGGDGRTDGHVAPKLLQPCPQGVFVFQYGELN